MFLAMRIYNETTQAFAQKCLSLIRTILTEEAHIKVGRSRFHINRTTYPIAVEIFTGKNHGYFSPQFYRIGINIKLMYTAKDKVLKDILRHELAHYLTFIEYGSEILPHGKEFHTICNRYGWPEDVSGTTLDVEVANDYEGGLEAEKIINKVKNLLKLADSDNVHEAQLATVKANQLLLKYNIKHLAENQGPTIYCESVMAATRKDSKMEAIYAILTHFMVSPIFNYGSGEVRLEIAGTKTNLELAKYVAEFLSYELDRLWEITKREHRLKGLRVKNSFFAGLAVGHAEKMQEAKAEFNANETKALIKVTNQLKNRVTNLMSLRAGAHSQGQTDCHGLLLGHAAGKKLNINRPVSGDEVKLLR